MIKYSVLQNKEILKQNNLKNFLTTIFIRRRITSFSIIQLETVKWSFQKI